MIQKPAGFPIWLSTGFRKRVGFSDQVIGVSTFELKRESSP
jgi:hypothetical protein